MHINTLTQRQLPEIMPVFTADISPLLQRIYALRGITSMQELDYSARNLCNFNQLKGIATAVELLYLAIKKQQKIMIVGDFDTDGATSTALVIKALKNMGYQHVDYIIPDRFIDGYGLSVTVVQKALAKQCDMIITVDNGISANEAVEYAKQAKLTVIVTDHHLAPPDLPCADAIINPNQADCPFPSKNLAGVGVAFYFMLALRAKLRQENWFIDNNLAEYNVANLLDLVALGTIADVVKLDTNNRILVHQGVNRIRSNYCCVGIKALLKSAQKEPSGLSATDLAFYIAPRLNAAGRMDNMSLGVKLLLAEDEKEALTIANDLNMLNLDRRTIEQTMKQEAINYLKQIEQNNLVIPNGLVVYHPKWHQGIIGILSSRIKDKYYRPVISFALTEEGLLKGSGRSIRGVHLRDILDEIDQTHPNLILSFGGHAMAVGLTIHERDLEIFSNVFKQLLDNKISDDLLQQKIETDGEVSHSELNYSTAKQLIQAGPWGEGFEQPQFEGEFIVHQQRLIADKHLKFVLEAKNGSGIIEAIQFNVDKQIWPDQTVNEIKIVYNLDVDEFRGNQNVKLLIRHLWLIK